MSAGDLFGALEPVIDAFEALGIRYRIGGSVASSAYGIARATLDVDLVADLKENHVRPLVDLLREGYYIDEDRVRDAVARRSSFNIVHLGSMIKVDVFVLTSRPSGVPPVAGGGATCRPVDLDAVRAEGPGQVADETVLVEYRLRLQDLGSYHAWTKRITTRTSPMRNNVVNTENVRSDSH